MHVVRIGLVLLVGLMLSGQFSSCRSLALSGAQKYKVDLTQAMMKVQVEIEQEGQVSERTLAKLENVLEKYGEEFSKKGSYIRASQVLDNIKEAQGDPNNQFQMLRSTLIVIDEVLETLKTEVSR